MSDKFRLDLTFGSVRLVLNGMRKRDIVLKSLPEDSKEINPIDSLTCFQTTNLYGLVEIGKWLVD